MAIPSLLADSFDLSIGQDAGEVPLERSIPVKQKKLNPSQKLAPQNEVNKEVLEEENEMFNMKGLNEGERNPLALKKLLQKKSYGSIRNRQDGAGNYLQALNRFSIQFQPELANDESGGVDDKLDVQHDQ